MQETRPEDMTVEQAEQLNKLRQEFFPVKKGRESELVAQMDQRLGELNRKHGEVLVRRKKIGRNEPCPCNSGRKFKRCCITKLHNN